jgi:RNA polymerase sigma-70 factor (ECF subfamily)
MNTYLPPRDVAAFDRVRPRLFGIAYRVLGNRADADEVVQEAWIRWQGTDRAEIRDSDAFLATATTRLAINLKQSARARRVTYVGDWMPEAIDTDADPARSAEQADALERAALVLLAKLTPAERGVYVLREAFDYSFRQIADALGLSEANARQLFRRAGKHLSGADRNAVSTSERRRFVDAFRLAVAA